MIKLYLIFSLFFFTGFSVSQAPFASFSASNLKVCAGTSIYFSNSSSGNIKSSNWDFGDGVTSQSSGIGSMEHTYSSPGKYTVTLLVITPNGIIDDEEKKLYIEILNTPKAALELVGEKCQVPATISVINNSVQNPGNSYQWSFGNGQTTNAISPGQVSFNSEGKFSVSLTISNPNSGCNSSISQTIQIWDYRASVKGDVKVCANDPAKLIATANKNIDAYSWDFGNGTSGPGNDTVSVTYSKAKKYYYPSVTVTNNQISCKHTEPFQIEVMPLPAPVFSVNTQKVCPNFSVSFTNSTQGGSDFKWNFGDGGTFFGKQPPPYTYKSESDYAVTLSCKGNNGCFGSTTYSKFISVKNPEVVFSADSTKGCADIPVNFIDKSTSPNDENPIVGWQWDFGNGNTFSGKNPNQQIYGIGNYDVSLKITSMLGCVVSKKNIAMIRVGLIDGLKFTVLEDSLCIKEGFQFKEAIKISAPYTKDEVTYTWDFGDKTILTKYNPIYAYTKDIGFFDVKLIADFRGCLDSFKLKKAVYVKPPLSLFKPESILYCNPKSFPVEVKLLDQSKAGFNDDIVTVDWVFGDGKFAKIDTLNLSNPLLGSIKHNYSDYGKYKVFQKVTNHTTGCIDTMSKIFHISWTKSSFDLSNDSVCRFSKIKMKEKSTSFDPLVNWVFFMGDGAAVVGRDTAYRYPNASTYMSNGNYILSLVSSNNVGCADTAYFTNLKVLQLPKAAAVTANKIGCIPFDVKFQNTSKVQENGVALASFDWFFAIDSSKQTSQNVNQQVHKTFLIEGDYYSYIQATDVFGCKSFVDSVLVLIPKPTTEFKIDSIVCNNEVFTTINKTKGLGIQKYKWYVDNVLSSQGDSLSFSFNEIDKSNLAVYHSVRLTAADEIGCKDSLTKTVIVSLPRANFSYTPESLIENNVNENGEFKCPPVLANYSDLTQSIGKIDSSLWDFELGKKSIKHEPTTYYYYPGIYSTYLKSVDQFGCSDDTLLSNFLTILGPKATFKHLGLGDICGKEHQFTMSNLENATRVVWNLDDGRIVPDSITFRHVYMDISIFGPSADLFDKEGCKVTYAMDSIKIPGAGMSADFTANKKEFKLGETLLLQDYSIGGNSIKKWDWDLSFGDTVKNTTAQDVQKKYTKGGVKPIVLTIYDKNNCSDQFKQLINVIDDYDVPNFLTPNGDFINDSLVLFDSIFKYFSIHIYNRWGNSVYNLKNNKGTLLWNGKKQNDTPCEAGVYFYKLEGILEDGNALSKSGFVTLIHGAD